MFIPKLKLLSITLFILITTLTAAPTHACEEPIPIPWYHLKITPFLPPLPPTIEIIVEDRKYWGQDSLTITNNSDVPIYVVRDIPTAKDLQTIFNSSIENKSPSEWSAQLAILRTERAPISPAQMRVIYTAKRDEWVNELAQWPADYGGRRSIETRLPEPRSNGIALVHQGGVHLIPFSESIVLNPDYPDKEIWHGCPEEYYEEPVSNQSPILIATEDTAVTDNKSFQLFWLITGALLLALAAWGINKWNEVG